MKKVAIIILNWNGEMYLKKYLPRLVKYSSGKDKEIVVADNGSTDHSIQYLETYYPNITIVSMRRNNGFAGGYNHALYQINAQYYVLLNTDVEVTQNWLDPVIREMDNDSSIAACMPKIRAYHNRSYFEYAGAAGGFMDRYGYPFCRGRIFDTIEPDTGQYDTPTDIFWATGACMFIRGKAFRELKGFDEDYFAHMEEIDLCWRLKNRGYKIRYVPDSMVYHEGGGSLSQNHPHKLFLNFRNNLLTLYKNLPDSALLKIMISRFLLDHLAAFRLFLSGHFAKGLSIFKAQLAFVSQIGYHKLKRDDLQSYNTLKHPEIYGKSIVYQYFIRKRRTYDQLEAE